MKHQIYFVLLWTFLITTPCPAASFGRSEMVSDINQLFEDLKRGWAHYPQKAGRLGWDDWKQATIDAIPESQSREAFLGQIRQIIAQLQDGHASVQDPQSEPSRKLPLRLRNTVDGIIVWRPLTGGIYAGEKLLSINGDDVEELITRNETTVSASHVDQKRIKAIDSLLNVQADLDAIEVIVQQLDGKVRRCGLPAVEPRPFVPEPWIRYDVLAEEMYPSGK